MAYPGAGTRPTAFISKLALQLFAVKPRAGDRLATGVKVLIGKKEPQTKRFFVAHAAPPAPSGSRR